ncbi:fimbrial biogenesis chaperone [Novilysobacter erysipheiresistens]|uniref:Molecular chaperone n=1 Tax=Novilysobacter erysipheiresistens TaxID=1749332 RepID=A0ABU7YUV5_9GAMM
MYRFNPKTWPSLVLIALLGLCGPTHAASLQVAPTSVELQAGENGAAVWLSNTDPDTPVRAQVRLFRWTQQDGEDTLEPTRDLAISPPLVELAGGARQLVRVIRTGPPPTGVEASYRIIVDEVPSGTAVEQTGLKFLLRYSIPVFVLPAGGPAIAYDIAPRLERTGDAASLVVENRGHQHAQLADLAYIDADGKRDELMSGLVGYVLPGQTMRWALPASATRYADGGSFKARINGEAVEQTLALGPAAR